MYEKEKIEIKIENKVIVIEVHDSIVRCVEVIKELQYGREKIVSSCGDMDGMLIDAVLDYIEKKRDKIRYSLIYYERYISYGG